MVHNVFQTGNADKDMAAVGMMRAMLVNGGSQNEHVRNNGCFGLLEKADSVVGFFDH